MTGRELPKKSAADAARLAHEAGAADNRDGF
jgi:hypothetical protein